MSVPVRDPFSDYWGLFGAASGSVGPRSQDQFDERSRGLSDLDLGDAQARKPGVEASRKMPARWRYRLSAFRVSSDAVFEVLYFHALLGRPKSGQFRHIAK